MAGRTKQCTTPPVEELRAGHGRSRDQRPSNSESGTRRTTSTRLKKYSPRVFSEKPGAKRTQPESAGKQTSALGHLDQKPCQPHPSHRLIGARGRIGQRRRARLHQFRLRPPAAAYHRWQAPAPPPAPPPAKAAIQGQPTRHRSQMIRPTPPVPETAPAPRPASPSGNPGSSLPPMPSAARA